MASGRWPFGAAAVSVAVTACSLLYDPDRYESGSGGADAGDAGDAGAGDASCDGATNDPANCGACGHDCQGAACNAGLCEPQVLAVPANQPSAILYGDGHLYWTEPGGIRSAAALGTSAAAIDFPDAGGVQFPIALRDADAFIVAVTWGGTNGGSQLYAASKGAAFAAGMARLRAGETGRLLSVPAAADGGTIFVSTLATGAPGGQIVTVPLASPDAGTTELERTSTQPFDLAVSGTSILFTAGTTPIADAGKLEVDSVFIHAIGGGPQNATTVTSGETLLGPLIIAKDHVYWSAAERGGVVRRATLDGTSIEDFASAPRIEGALAHDDAHVFWMTAGATSSEPLSLWGCAIASAPCRPLRLADVPADAKLGGALPVTVGLAAGGDWLYFTEPGRNLIARVSAKTP